MQQTYTPQNDTQQSSNAPSPNMISMNITLEHAMILAQVLDTSVRKGLDEISLDGQNVLKPPMVGAYVCEMAAKLNLAIQQTVQEIHNAQQQAMQAQAMTGAPGTFGTGQMPNAAPQSPQQVVNSEFAMPQNVNMAQPTALDASGVAQVPLQRAPQQGQAQQQMGAPTLMPQSNVNPNAGSVQGPANGAAGSPIITKP